MKRLLSIVYCNVAALLVLSMAASAQTTPAAKPAPAPAMTKTTTKSKVKASTPKTDADIQKCIEDKLSGSKLKGNAAQFAKRCGATKVTNNITVESTPKTKAAKTADGAATKTPKKP